MFERFTDRARKVVVLAQDEARRLDHNYIGTEHLLLGLIHEGKGVGARAIERLGISLEAVRQQVEELIGKGQQAPSGHIPFTPRAKRVLQLSLREALQLGHNYIGTEHLLLGLVREGDGVAAQVLVRLGADLNRVRQQVIELLHAAKAAPAKAELAKAEPAKAEPAGAETLGGARLSRLEIRLDAMEKRLAAIEQRVGSGPDTSDLDEQIETVRREKESAVVAQEYERAASLRDQESQLLESKTTRQEEWAASHPGLPALGEQGQQLSREIEQLRALLRQNGVEPEEGTA